MVKLHNFNSDEELISQVDVAIANSKNKFKDRTHFVVLALQEKIEREIGFKPASELEDKKEDLQE